MTREPRPRYPVPNILTSFVALPDDVGGNPGVSNDRGIKGDTWINEYDVVASPRMPAQSKPIFVVKLRCAFANGLNPDQLTTPVSNSQKVTRLRATEHVGKHRCPLCSNSSHTPRSTLSHPAGTPTVLWSAAAVYAVLPPVYRVPAGGRTVRSTGGRDQRGPDLCDWAPLYHGVGDRGPGADHPHAGRPCKSGGTRSRTPPALCTSVTQHATQPHHVPPQAGH